MTITLASVRSRYHFGGATVALGLAVAIAAEAAPPDLSPLAFLPGDAALAPAAGLQEQPAIAAGGPGYLAVWSDARSSVVSLAVFDGGPYFAPGIGTMRDIYAMRLDLDGNAVDATPIVVDQAVLNQGFPAVAWNGQNWLVVWMGQDGLACCPNIHIYAARVSPGGVVLDDPPIVVDTDPTSSGLRWPDVASDGTNWAVVWRDIDDGAGIYTLDGARVSPDGVVLDPGGKRLRRDTYNSYPLWPSIAFAGDEYLLVWNEATSKIAAQRLDLALDKIGGVFQVNLLADSDGRRPGVSSDGSAFFVAWFEDRYYGFAQLFGARVAHSGAILDPAGIEITSYAGYTQFAPAVTWDGTQWIVGYNIQKVGFNDDLCATRVAASGAVLDPAGIPLAESPAGEFEAGIAAAPGGGARLVWQVIGGSVSGDIYSAAIVPDGTPGAATCVSLGAPRQTQPEIAGNGNGYLVVFRSETSLTARLLGQRLDAGGAPLDAEPFEIAAGDVGASGPAVAWDGTRYLVAWSTAQPLVRARRFAIDGTSLDAAPIDVMPGSEPDVAALGDVFLVVGTHAQDPHFRYPYSVRVRGADGAKLDPSPVLLGAYFVTNPSVRALGTRWFVAWQQNPSHDNPRSDIVANFVGANGIPATPFGLTSTSITVEVDPFVSVGPDTALVGWAEGDLRGRRILADGTLLDPTPFALSAAAGAQLQPEGDWDGGEHVVLFTDQRNDASTGPYVGDLYGTRVAGDGGLLDPDGFPVANVRAVPELDPAVAGAQGQAALGCAVFVPASPLGAYRIGLRLLNPAPTDVEPPAIATPRGVLVAAPNPFGESIMFSFRSQRDGRVVARVYDARGRLVRTLATGRSLPGVVHLTWDGRDASGRDAPPGIYFVRLATGNGARVAKIVRR